MQTILGAGGVIANNLAKALRTYTDSIRLVSRHPKALNPEDDLFPADLNDPVAVAEAVKGSDIVYLTAGLPYRSRVWEAQWPRIMQNCISACRQSGARLVFFDNVYAYGKVEGWMTEETPYNPCSRKGEVRSRIATLLMEEVKKGNLQAQILRAADFYGPHTPLSFITVTVFDKLAKGKKAQLMVSENTRHSLTYTPDAGKATALLGNSPGAYNQVWHLPTDRHAPTGKEIVEMAARHLQTEPRYQVIGKGMLRMAGLFVPVLRESIEMLYQNEYDYLFSSEKFEKAFPGFPLTRYEEGIAASAAGYFDRS